MREQSCEHRNRTQKLIMHEIMWLHDLVFMKNRGRQYFNDWFRLRQYLFTKYKIPNPPTEYKSR